MGSQPGNRVPSSVSVSCVTCRACEAVCPRDVILGAQGLRDSRVLLLLLRHAPVLSRPVPSRPVPSRPVPSPSPSLSLSPKKVIETENFAKQSCQIYYKGDKNTSKVMLLPPPPKPLNFWARGSQATYIQHNLKFHHLSRVGPKQWCAIAHLECTLVYK